MGKKTRGRRKRQGHYDPFEDNLLDQPEDGEDPPQPSMMDLGAKPPVPSTNVRKKLRKLKKMEQRNQRGSRKNSKNPPVVIRAAKLFAGVDGNSDMVVVVGDRGHHQVGGSGRGPSGDSTLIWHKVRVPLTGGPAIASAILPRLMAAFGAAGHIDDEPLTPPQDSFAPICVKQGNKEVSFYVESLGEARVLRSLSAGTPGLEGLKVRVETSSSPPEMSLVGGVAKDKIRSALAGRYSGSTKSLNLRAFHRDPELCRDLYAPLAKSSVMSAVIDLVSDCPASFLAGLEGLDLSRNRLRSLAHLPSLAEVLLATGSGSSPFKWIDLRDNVLDDVGELEKLRLFKPVALMLSGNSGLEKKFRADKEAYAKAVKAALPSLVSLDNNDFLAEFLKLPMVPRDDEGAPGGGLSLPAPVKKMASAPDAESVVLTFIDQYLKLFDSQDRSGLGAAYHEEALLSVSASYPPDCAATGVSRLAMEFLQGTRNLLRVKGSAKRGKLLKRGRQAIVDHLCQEFPKSQHSRESLTLDITLATPELVSFTLTGVFVEGDPLVVASRPFADGKRPPPVRHFCRMWNIVPFGGGFVVVNEMVYVTIATRCQIKESFGNSLEERVPASYEILESLRNQTGMSEEWCKKCLDQSGWVLQPALSAFSVARQEGRIPQEAFSTWRQASM